MKRALLGALAGVLATVALAAVLVPARSDLSIATVALILVVPVVLGVVIGGVAAGVVSVGAGFIAYDFAFIPPYYTMTVGAAQNWVALAVYAVVMLLVAQVVSRLQAARTEALQRAGEAQQLFELSELLVTDRSLPDLLQSTADTVLDVFGVAGVALLLPEAGHLTMVAAAGHAPSPADLRDLEPDSGVPVAIGPTEGRNGDTLQAMVLSAAGRPVGILALHGPALRGTDLALLRTFVNHAALAIERGQLRDQALRSQLLEETDRMRRALLGAVSHDLRTPLATMKIAASSLLEAGGDLAAAERKELYGLIDGQADRLGRLVTGLLDMNRYQAGVLQLRLTECEVSDLIDDALAAMGPSLSDRSFQTDIQPGLPPVQADRVLIGQVLVNLLDNADRYAPPGTPISLSARRAGDRVVVTVTDQGPGVPESERTAVFESFYGSDTGSRTGLGLWICRTFVEAHGQEITVDGSRFSFTLGGRGQAPQGSV